MKHRVQHFLKKTLSASLGAVVIVILLYSCASMGRPDGGPYDETPPRFLGSTPEYGALHSNKKKVSLHFDEYIKLEKASEKVVVSPPQVQMPVIKAAGKKIIVELQDSLKPQTTYTFDFSDAIVDNNEGNPLGDFSFLFSTGDVVDTMQVSGILLEASNLEPVKGMLVGLHSNLNDSAFTTLPFERVGRTDSRGHFRIGGIAKGSYRIFALLDADQNFMFSQKTEALAYNDSLVVPYFEERTHFDTLWIDTLTVDTIFASPYTHYLPDNLVLRSFKEDVYNQYFVKSERLTPEKFTFYFAAKADSLPVLKGINFDETDAFIIEKNLTNDTIHYWMKDSLIYQQDTLSMAVTYLFTDTLQQLVPRTDTLNLVPKRNPKKEKAQQKEKEAEKKKKKRNKDDEEEHDPIEFLSVKATIPSSMDVYGNISLEFSEPVSFFDTAAIVLKEKVDTLWLNVPYELEHDSVCLRRYNFYHDWKPDAQYEFSVDSTAFHSIYGLFTDKLSQKFKVRKLEDYGTIYFDIQGVNGPAFVELLNAQDKVVRRRKVVNNRADFYFLKPQKYGARLIKDDNENGRWDTGNYADKQQPEWVYYYSQLLEPRANWELEQTWDVTLLPLDQQKPEEMKKQKPDAIKKKRTRQR